jgi:hypothetical protein
VSLRSRANGGRAPGVTRVRDVVVRQRVTIIRWYVWTERYWMRSPDRRVIAQIKPSSRALAGGRAPIDVQVCRTEITSRAPSPWNASVIIPFEQAPSSAKAGARSHAVCGGARRLQRVSLRLGPGLRRGRAVSTCSKGYVPACSAVHRAAKGKAGASCPSSAGQWTPEHVDAYPLRIGTATCPTSHALPPRREPSTGSTPLRGHMTGTCLKGLRTEPVRSDAI